MDGSLGSENRIHPCDPRDPWLIYSHSRSGRWGRLEKKDSVGLVFRRIDASGCPISWLGWKRTFSNRRQNDMKATSNRPGNYRKRRRIMSVLRVCLMSYSNVKELEQRTTRSWGR